MATDPGAMCQFAASQSPAAASSGVPSSAQPQRNAPRRRIGASLPAWRGFCDGFVGGLIGGLIYCLVLAWFQTVGLELACLRALALSLILGGFEMWRVTRGRRSKRVAACLLWTLAASGVMFWALGAVLPGKERSRPETPPQITHSRLALIQVKLTWPQKWERQPVCGGIDLPVRLHRFWANAGIRLPHLQPPRPRPNIVT